MVVGAAPDPIAVDTADLIFGGRSIIGSLTGTPVENEENLAFAQSHGIKSMNEVMAFEDAPEGVRAHDVGCRPIPDRAGHR